MSQAPDSQSALSANSSGDRLRELCRALERTQRLLIIRLRSLGDSILAIPLVEAFHAWRPDLQLDMLVEAPYGALFVCHPAVHETLIVKPRNGFAQEGWSRIRACLEIRKRRYSAVVNLHGGSTSWLFSLSSGAGLRIGQQKYRHAWAYHALIPSPAAVWQRGDLHTVEDQLTLLRWLNLPIPEKPRGRIYIDDQAQNRIREKLIASGIRNTGYILIQPTATLRTKQWREANFAQLADCLYERFAYPIIFSSAPREAQVLLNIGGRAKNMHRYWSDLALDDLLALIAGCRLFIGNDSGPTHAAAALAKPLVVVWGSSDFRVWHPWETESKVVRLQFPCMPCPGYTCTAFGTPRCIDDIAVGQVLEACEQALVMRNE